jgi:hypothetical protein
MIIFSLAESNFFLSLKKTKKFLFGSHFFDAAFDIKKLIFSKTLPKRLSCDHIMWLLKTVTEGNRHANGCVSRRQSMGSGARGAFIKRSIGALPENASA